MPDNQQQLDPALEPELIAYRDDLQAGADLMSRIMARKVEIVHIPGLTLGKQAAAPADAQTLEELHRRLQNVEAVLDNGVGQATVSTALAAMADNMARIADALTPKPADIVGSPYVAKRLGCTTTWIAEMVRKGEIPKSCLVPGTGNGKPWKFFREKIEAWIALR